jgi:hypothetical protein
MTDARASIHAMFPLDEAATAELDLRLDALIVEALIKAGVQYVDCPVCGAAQPVGGGCGTCAFKARMAAELAARGMAVPASTAEFFQPGHTYAHEHHASTIRFLVRYIDDSPEGIPYRVAFGWKTEDGDVCASPFDSDDFTGWTDVTQGGSRG